MKVISILNEKGGVGKTQTSINIAVGLSRMEYKVLLIDCDPQANTTQYFKFDKTHIYLEDMLMDNTRGRVYETNYPGLDLIPCTKKLALTAQLLATETTNQLERLGDIIAPLENYYDFVIIDLLPTLNLLTTNALYASDMTISPVTIDTEAIAGFFSTRENILQLSNDYNISIDHYILFNKISLRSKIDRGLIEDLRATGALSFNQLVRYQGAPMKKASLKRVPVIDSFAKTNGVGQDFRALNCELVEKLGLNS